MANVDASNTSGERGSQLTGPAQTSVASPHESRGPENGGIVSTIRGHSPPLRPSAVRQSSSNQGSFIEAPVVSLISNRPILAINNVERKRRRAASLVAEGSEVRTNHHFLSAAIDVEGRCGGLAVFWKDSISDCDLTDIPIEGHQFTWIKSRGTPHVIEERLDRAMTSTSWLQLFPQRMWWLRVGGRENLEVIDRVTRCANKLQRWEKKKRIRFKEEIDECVRRMNELRGNQDEEGSIQYQELSERHATLLIQEEGKKKKVTKLIADNGTEAHTQEELCEVAKSYFDILFKPRDGDHDLVLNLIQPRVTDDDNLVLMAPITKDEIQQALFQMHPDKSPGPDGFTPASSRKTKGRRGELALKIDISKAYDKVDWGFLRGVMTRMGFTDVWIRWVMMCVSSVNYSVLMNSNRVGPISPGRGLQQGDPLSPYLFILVTECLTALIHQAVGRGDLHGVRICRGAPEVSRLLFADDCFLFCRANVAEVNELMRILHTYETASGQEVNLVKSEVFISRNMSQAAKEDLSRILGVKLVLGTSIYLGLPSMVGRSKKAIFSYIKDRIWKRINSWRGRALSKAGKEIMIKSILQVIPSYVMSMFILPASLIDDIEKMINVFWWRNGSTNNNNNTKGIHWLAWERLACPKAYGGLGFRNFESFNKAMVVKKVWNIVQNLNSLVAKLIKARYFPRSSLFEAPLAYNPSFAWRSMWQARQIFSLGCRWRIGSGDNIRVMHDPWLRGSANRWVPSPQPAGVYQLSVRDLLHDNYKAWNIVKVQNLFSRDVAEKIMETPLVSSVREDKVVWDEERNGCYSVKSGGCLPTRSRLLERRVEYTLNCLVCDEEIEEELHIFFRCAVARDSWSAAGLSSVLHNATYQQTNAMDRIFAICINESSDTVGRVAMLLWCIWQNLHKLQSNNVSGTTKADLVRWEKPTLDWVKCNVDVAFVAGSGRTSMGLCFRDNSGHFMADMTQWQQTVISSVEGEAWALLLAMEEARHRGLNRVQFESDSKVLIEVIHMKRRNSEFLLIVHDILSLMSSFINFEVKFVRRQANLVAHTLARAANSWASFHRAYTNTCTKPAAATSTKEPPEKETKHAPYRTHATTVEQNEHHPELLQIRRKTPSKGFATGDLEKTVVWRAKNTTPHSHLLCFYILTKGVLDEWEGVAAMELREKAERNFLMEIQGL
ncbi:hypothetical protein TSUD_98640 [Trifolium subterraneum]|uniref:Reverse transcriptase domain-containing protein n=1 Tax=Trifolium subterraneum TaxID=3900 RepID=A0A2Z6NW93_TRISU|nr:hypothetical protein TSUD_98640 [Trifolium subterraneum]